ncbi:MAG: biotin/lipoate A/B protein ligase family protein [Syntrophomonadaceae bacterium]|nr:biotin/lipoate A/B protein ligase family protein [Syntrophomonadaceae bacterium]
MSRLWRLIRSGRGEPAWNMAVDEALVTVFARGGVPPALRLYTWHPPALSLGYFQGAGSVRREVLEKLGIALVRRVTGGRAVLHCGDLTYSIVARAGRDTPEELSASYRYLCSGLLHALSALGIEADPGSDKTGRSSPASCFAVAAPSDITWKSRKFVGSAQKRYGSAILQHGSILIKPQEKLLAEIFADDNGNFNQPGEKVTCLEGILEREVDLDEVSEVLIGGFEHALNIKLVACGLNPEEHELAESLVDKYRQV